MIGTPGQVATVLRGVAQDLRERVLISALRDEVQPARADAQRALEATTLGGKLSGRKWSTRKAQGGKLSGRRGLRVSGTVHTRGTKALVLETYGLAALIDQGGRTRAHEIDAAGGVLAFQAKGGILGRLFGGGSSGLTFARRVKHPGGQVRRHDVMAGVLERAEGRVAQSIDRHAADLLRERLFSGGR